MVLFHKAKCFCQVVCIFAVHVLASRCSTKTEQACLVCERYCYSNHARQEARSHEQPSFTIIAGHHCEQLWTTIIVDHHCEPWWTTVIQHDYQALWLWIVHCHSITLIKRIFSALKDTPGVPGQNRQLRLPRVAVLLVAGPLAIVHCRHAQARAQQRPPKGTSKPAAAGRSSFGPCPTTWWLLK